VVDTGRDAPLVPGTDDGSSPSLLRQADTEDVGLDSVGLDSVGLDYVGLFRQLPTPYMVMDLDLRYVEVNEAYLATTGRRREELIGAYVFDAFPPTPDALDEEGVSFVQRSFERARDSGSIDTMPMQKYAIPDGDGGMSERWWSLISVPVRGPDGQVALVAQRAEDVTDWVHERSKDRAERERSEQLTQRVHEVEADLYARAHELEAALAARAAAAARLTSLAAAAMDLTSAETVEDLAGVVLGRGVPTLGGDGGVIAVREDDRHVLRLATGASPADSLPGGEIALDSDLPAAHVARTGERVLLAATPRGVALHPLTGHAHEELQQYVGVGLPLQVGDRLLGSLMASWEQARRFAPHDIDLLEGFAAQVSVALQRIRATAAERAAAREVARLSEALQRSLLTEPPHPAHLTIAVRYQPAAQEAQVGGDWYDAFVTGADAPMVVVGDVGGHDREAAAAMAQIRNLLRGIAYESFDGPGTLMGRLDRAIQGLGIDVLATALIARIEGGAAARQLRWSAAGHPPPVLRLPDGEVVVLDQEPDLLLGLDQHRGRREHVAPFPVGSLLLLYTDGLIERRGCDLEVGIGRVVEAMRQLTTADPEAAAQAVLAVADTNEDDIALLLVRAD
jgi:PAS domain S-box-containing protein